MDKEITDSLCGENSNEIGYEVFYGNSEEEAKLLAITYIQNRMKQEESLVERPDIPFRLVLKGIVLPITLYLLISVVGVVFEENMIVWFCILIYALVFVLTVKQTVILLVLLYQKYAPERIRMACCFEPTCSNYMLLAIEKYGFWKGFLKGVCRLCRCHYPNGGVDYP